MINIKPNLIGIAGDPQVGKNTVGKIILYLTYVEQKEKEGIIPTIGLKDFIEKEITSAYCDWYIKRFDTKFKQISSILEDIIDPDITKEFLQDLQNFLKDNVHPDTWINALFKDYQLQNEDSTYLNPYPSIEYPSWIISDLKHDNEFKAIKERGGLCIKVINIERYKPVTAMLAKTELSSCKFDFIIENFGNIDDLVEEVRKMLIYFKLLEK